MGDTAYKYVRIEMGVTDSSVKLDQDAPGKPTLYDEVSATTIMVQNDSLNKQYAISTTNSAEGLTWDGALNDGYLFFGLTPNTTYYVFVRMAATETYNASPASEPLVVKTAKAKLTGELGVSGTLKYGETLTAVTSGLTTNVPGYTDFGTLSYQWARYERGRGTDYIPGATNASYTLTAADIGFEIVLIVKSTNCTGQFSVNMNANIVVTKADGLVPVLDFSVSDTDGGFPKTITITPVDGAEYDVGEDYGSENFITSEEEEELVLRIRLEETLTHNASGASTITINTANQNQDTPAPFELTYKANAEQTSYTVTIPPTDGAEYSFDGVNWSDTNSKTALLPGETVIGYKRMKAKVGYNASGTVSDSVTRPLFQVKTPTASPNGGNFTGSVSVTLVTETSGALIYYTTDGSDPKGDDNPSAKVYNGSFVLTETATVKAVTSKSGMSDSEGLTVTFTKLVEENNNNNNNNTQTPTIPPTTTPTTTTPPATTPSAPPAATVVTDDGRIVSAGEVTVNTDTKTVEVIVNQDTITREIAAATDNVTIVVPVVAGTNTAEVALVVQNIADISEREVTLTVQTAAATLTFNGDALNAIASAGKADNPVVISAGTVAKADLSEALRDSVPDNALVVDLTVTVGTKTVSNFNGGIVTVTIPYTLPAGVRSTQIVVYYLNDSGNLELVTGIYNPETRMVELTLRHFSRYVIKINDVKYAVGKGWYNAESIDFAVQRGLIAVANGIVEPTGETSRADFVVAAMKALGIQPFTTFKVKQFSDVSHLSAEQQAYLWTARELAVINGVGGDIFDPDSPALREHFFQIVSNIYRVNLAALPEATVSKTAADFADGADVPKWALPAVNKLISRGIIRGDGSKLQIGEAFNNAATAEVLMRLGGTLPNLPEEAIAAKSAVIASEPEKQYSESEDDSGDDVA
ncbi:hypothetical protein FACS1894105_07440 [Clostridia bacterium]|nr:hypothetical protein FACS1894105_07440 [Clostridia bacterium]